MRVNVQLIKAANDSHLWADTFDRKLTDIFSVESEVAKAIADQLRAKLTGQEEQVIAAKPTDNRGSLRCLPPWSGSTESCQLPTRLPRRNIFEKRCAWTRSSPLVGRYFHGLMRPCYRSTGLPQTIALREEARQAAETALTLQPNLGEAVLAKGFYHYACLRDYDTARALL